MQTTFSRSQLADPQIAESEKILRACVHCGFCTATCPTYVLLGDELDSPRGRIYLIKEMLEQDRPATADVVKHVDRCLSCLACMTTCPSGVHYMHLVDHAREHIERTYKRPFGDRLLRALLARTLPYRGRFRAALALSAATGFLARPLLRSLSRLGRKGATANAFQRLAAMLDLSSGRAPPALPHERPGIHRAIGERRGRVALLLGCASEVLAPSINAAAIRLLTRNGVEVVVAEQEGCCGSLVHHMGREDQALAMARRNIDAWVREAEGEGLDAIVITASGCGTTVKDYGFMLRTDPAYAAKAEWISSITRDITEYLATLVLPPAEPRDLTVAYHAACSLQHGQRVLREPKQLLANAGLTVREPLESHLCCGSAGTYNMLEPDISARLRERKAANIERLAPDLIATGNIGCMVQIGHATGIPIVHTVELLDWMYGGPVPRALEHIAESTGSLQRPALERG